jgi:pimeloyl-ACP methyl ester carboxylesterase
MATRRSRLSAVQNAELDLLFNALDSPVSPADKDAVFARVGALLSGVDEFEPMSGADEFEPLPGDDEAVACQHHIYDAVWPQVADMRSNGELLRRGGQIACPVVAIHGDYDPHPAAGVKEPLSRVVPDFRFMLLKDCGHTPWRERRAEAEFYKILEAELA